MSAIPVPVPSEALPRAAEPLESLAAEFIRHLALERKASCHTVQAYRISLVIALEFFRGKLPAGEPPRAGQLSARLSREFLAWLGERGYAAGSIVSRMSALRAFAKFLVREGALARNPTEGLCLPRPGRRLPRLLGAGDVGRLLEAPPADTRLGARDKAILETLYSAGLRVSELTGLDVEDLDLGAGVCKVRGKGDHQRLGYLGGPALAALRAWLPTREVLAARRAGPQPACSSTARARG